MKTIKIIIILALFVINTSYKKPEKYTLFYQSEDVRIFHPVHKELNFEKVISIHEGQFINDFKQEIEDSVLNDQIRAYNQFEASVDSGTYKPNGKSMKDLI